MKLHQILVEVPIRDITHIGDFNKSSSFRKKADRELVSNPKLVQKLRNKFENTHHDFDFYFVNSPEGNRHTEVGKVTMEWLKENMPKAAKQIREPDGETIVVIFTNNKGAQGIPATPWILAHRIGHALARYSQNFGTTARQFHAYTEHVNHLWSSTAELLDYYYQTPNFPDKEPGFRTRNRADELLARNFWEQIGTFKSARDNKLRDHFEFANELIAQYLTTGEIKFNQLPEVIKGKNKRYLTKDQDKRHEIENDMLRMARDIDYYIDALFGSAYGSILVM